jgi:hypothetical protein
VSLFTDWQRPLINEVWIKTRNGAGQVFKAPAEFFCGEIGKAEAASKGGTVGGKKQYWR